MLITFGVLALIVGLLGLLGYYCTPRSIVVLGISAVSPYLALGTLTAVVLFAIGRSWIGLGLSVALLGWHVAAQAPLFFAAAVPTGGHDVVVLTANLKVGLADPVAVVAAVRSHAVEVLLLEELTQEEADALRAAGLDEVLPHSVADPRPMAAGTGLWSKYPLTDTDKRDDFDLAFVTARVAVPGSPQPPTFVALHMSGPYPHAPRWVRDMDHLPGVLRGLPSDAPVLVGGDFNATPDVTQFRRLLRGGYAHAGSQAGAGFQPSYPADLFLPPAIAIDHVLTRGAVAHRAELLDVAGSDHRALLVTVRLPRVA